MRKTFGVLFAVLLMVLTVGYPQVPATRDFRHPKTAVVDLQTVYEGYARSKDLESSLQSKYEEVEARIRELEGELQRVQAELKIVAGEPAERELVVKQSEISYDLEVARKRSLPTLRKERLDGVKKIIEEIKEDIAQYARGTGIDMVIEKKLIADLTPGLEISMVYFVVPEFEITEDITRRLNFRYKVK